MSNGVINGQSPEFAIEYVIPGGIICMWSGQVNNIPSGWLLCDGQNGTPDLRDRFILGAGGKYGVGATGGEEQHILTVSEMPRHNHAIPASDAGGSKYPVFVDTRDNRNNVTIPSDLTGGNLPHNNMPPYYALCFIMKLQNLPSTGGGHKSGLTYKYALSYNEVNNYYRRCVK